MRATDISLLHTNNECDCYPSRTAYIKYTVCCLFFYFTKPIYFDRHINIITSRVPKGSKCLIHAVVISYAPILISIDFLIAMWTVWHHKPINSNSTFAPHPRNLSTVSSGHPSPTPTSPRPLRVPCSLWSRRLDRETSRSLRRAIQSIRAMFSP